jgi:hypothetical protein
VFAKARSKKLEFARWKKSFIRDCKIIGYKEGLPDTRLEGNLGAVNVLIENSNIEMTVGGGFSDELRRLIWDNRKTFFGAVIEAEGKKVFSSGKLRHPNLKRFHPEKNSPEVWKLLNTIKSLF